MSGAFAAQLLGRSWVPWQRHAAEIIGEKLPTGAYAYPIVIVTVPRQTGKTSMVLDIALGRVLQQSDYRVAYTAQTGMAVSEKFAERYAEIGASASLDGRLILRRAYGSERISVNDCYIRAFPPKDGALRGPALDLVIVDEAQEHDDLIGRALDATILPTLTTRPRRQIIILGTSPAPANAGGYLATYRELALAGAPGYALIEYGADDTDDTDDPAVWAARHPGFGRLTDAAALSIFRGRLGHDDFAREYLNVWPGKIMLSDIDPGAWHAIRATTLMPPGPVVLGADVSADRRSAAIAAAGPGPYLEIVESRAGPTEWLPARVAELTRRFNAPVVIDRTGPAGAAADRLARAGVSVLGVTTAQMGVACGDFVDAVDGRSMMVHPSGELDAAIQIAGRRPLGDGSFAWSRRSSAGSIATLVAGTLALYGHHHRPPDPLRPSVSAG